MINYGYVKLNGEIVHELLLSQPVQDYVHEKGQELSEKVSEHLLDKETLVSVTDVPNRENRVATDVSAPYSDDIFQNHPMEKAVGEMSNGN